MRITSLFLLLSIIRSIVMTQETEVTKDSTKVILGEGNEVIILKKG